MAKRLAYDLLGHPEPVNGRRVDQIDAAIQSGADRRDGFPGIGSAPHPTAHRPGSECYSRHAQLRAGNEHHLGVDLSSLCLSRLQHERSPPQAFGKVASMVLPSGIWHWPAPPPAIPASRLASWNLQRMCAPDGALRLATTRPV